MIVVEGQYVFNVYVKDRPKLIDEKNLISFTLVEYGGIKLPTYEMKITIHDKSHLSYFNEHHTLCVQIGEDKNSIRDLEFSMKIINDNEVQSGIIHVDVKGFMNIDSYLYKTVKNSHTGTSFNVMNSLMHNKYNLNITSNISNTNDYMIWKQSNITDFAFMNEVTTHAYIKDYAQLYTCININREFCIYDLVQLIKDQSIPHTFINTKSDNTKHIQISSDFYIDNSTALSNIKGGYARSMHIYDQTKREYYLLEINDRRPIIAESNVPNADTDISKDDKFKVLTSSMHKNYYKAEMLNMNRLSNLKSSKLWVSIEDNYVNVHPAQLANVLLKETGHSCIQQSGLYLIDRVVRQINFKQMNTHVLLCREAFNELR